jgi:hypothetical protein
VMLLALGSWLLALGSWLLALGSWLLALGSWLLALGSWPAVPPRAFKESHTVALALGVVDQLLPC